MAKTLRFAERYFFFWEFVNMDGTGYGQANALINSAINANKREAIQLIAFKRTSTDLCWP